MNNSELGKWGENLAVAYLEKLNFYILKRNYRLHHIEIDIVARKKDCLHIIEVKTRRSRNYGRPSEAVNYFKRRRLYLGGTLLWQQLTAENAMIRSISFDVIEIEGVADLYQITFLENCF